MSEVPKGWVETTLKECIELKYGQSLPKSERNPGEFSVYGSNGIIGTSERSITGAPVIIVGRKGSFGEVHYSNKSCFPIDTTYFIDKFDVFFPEFAFALLKYLPIKKLNRSTAIPGLNREDAYNLGVILPPLAEQKRIVAKLDILAARSTHARTELVRIDTLVNCYKRAMLSKAFCGVLTKNSNWKPFPAGKSYSGSNELFPVTWHVRKLGEISEIQSGVALGKRRTGNEPLLELPYLRVANVQRGWLNLEEIKTVAVTKKESEKLFLKTGDVLMNEGGDRDKLGRGWVWEGQIDHCIHQNHVFRVRLGAGVLPPRFLSYFANEFGQKHFFDEGKQTTNLASISKSKLAAMLVPVPPYDEAVEIVRLVESAFQKIDRLATAAKRALAFLGKLDEAILAKAFRGELVPQDENDEPASVLLERIKGERNSKPIAIPKPRLIPMILVEQLNQSRRRAMDKTREDVEPDHLHRKLGALGGRASSKDLWLRSEMTIDEFYKQLRVEMEFGRIHVGVEKDELVLS